MQSQLVNQVNQEFNPKTVSVVMVGRGEEELELREEITVCGRVDRDLGKSS